MQSHPQNDQEQPRSPNGATRRLEAFSDAVFAIAITLLVLNLQVPVLTTVTPQALVARHLGHVVGCVEHHGTYALSRAVARCRPWSARK